MRGQRELRGDIEQALSIAGARTRPTAAWNSSRSGALYARPGAAAYVPEGVPLSKGRGGTRDGSAGCKARPVRSRDHAVPATTGLDPVGARPQQRRRSGFSRDRFMVAESRLKPLLRRLLLRQRRYLPPQLALA